ncbi:MAG: hypothetical protein CL758_00190 [Chloroflexi bacterium]|nr:hypothetical protein [Chloroflexota bacterium]
MDTNIFNQALNLTFIGVSVAFGLLIFLMFSAYFTSFFTRKILNYIDNINLNKNKKIELEAINKSKAAVAAVTLVLANSKFDNKP